MKQYKLMAIACMMLGLSVALGAFGAHGLKAMVSPQRVESFRTGVQYQFYHSLALALAALVGQWVENRAWRTSIWCFAIGILLFSGSLYGFAIYEAMGTEGGRWLGPVTPLGGLFFMAGWFALAFAVWKKD
jgi:uncharacterized membrane protein YgdD (TMEM256/DUF423 family)